MSDLIERQAAIDALGEKPLGDTDWDLGCRNQWEWDTEILKTMPSAQQWIPVSSGNLPKVRQRVLCQCRAGIQEVLRLTDDGDWECIYPRAIYMKSFVVAWMPLPSPYKEGSDE